MDILNQAVRDKEFELIISNDYDYVKRKFCVYPVTNLKTGIEGYLAFFVVDMQNETSDSLSSLFLEEPMALIEDAREFIISGEMYISYQFIEHMDVFSLERELKRLSEDRVFYDILVDRKEIFVITDEIKTRIFSIINTESEKEQNKLENSFIKEYRLSREIFSDIVIRLKNETELELV